jgi:hypothetical protein
MADAAPAGAHSGRSDALAAAVASGGVERYEKLGRIGEGTYGVVYRARDRRAASAVTALQRWCARTPAERASAVRPLSPRACVVTRAAERRANWWR